MTVPENPIGHRGLALVVALGGTAGVRAVTVENTAARASDAVGATTPAPAAPTTNRRSMDRRRRPIQCEFSCKGGQWRHVGVVVARRPVE